MNAMIFTTGQEQGLSVTVIYISLYTISYLDRILSFLELSNLPYFSWFNNKTTVATELLL
jgi:hypothetical protein